MRTFPLVSLDGVLNGSAEAQYEFGPPTFFRGARASGPSKYWQSGAYGIVSVTDGIGQSYLWVQSTVHDGPAVEDGNIFLTYTQLEDPDKKGTYESFTCQTVYSTTQSHASLKDVIVRNYYGPGRFSETEGDDTGSNTSNSDRFFDINYEGLMYDQYSVWKPDSVNPLSSYRSKFDSSSATSSQTCTAYRSIQDSTNFILKAGKQFNLVQGFRVYETATSPTAKYSGESAIIQASIVESSQDLSAVTITTLGNISVALAATILSLTW